MAISPEEQRALLLAKLQGDAAQDAFGLVRGGPSAAPVPSEPSASPQGSAFLAALEGTGRRMVHDPRFGGAAGHVADPILGTGIGSGLAVAIPSLVDPPGRTGVTVRDPAPTTEVLQPMDTPLADVQPSKPLSRAQAFSNAVMGGGAGGLGQLKSDWQNARKGLLAGYNTEKELAGRKGVAQADRVDATADLQMADAARKQRDAEIQAKQDADAAAKHEQFLARNTELADDIGRQKIDPKRLWRNMSTGEKALGVAGSIVGGFLSGMKGGPNEFLDRFDKRVSQDIEAQQNEIDNKKASLSARNSVFGQMLQETGDRRLAALQTRNLMYEGAKQEITAQADRLGIPEVLANADLARNAIQQQQDKLNEQFAHEAYSTAQQQAAAAAAATRAAEERAWQRGMEVSKLALEQDKLNIERAKAMGLTPEDLAKQTQQLGKEMSDKDLAEGREGIEAAKRRLASAAPNEGLPGVGRMADFRARLKPEGLNTLNPVAQLADKIAGLSDEERVSRGDWNKLKLSYQKQITGSGASDEERKMLSDAFEGAKSPMEQRAAIQQADAYFNRRESAIKAGFDPRAVAAFEARLNANNPQLPSTVKVKR